jgi:tellurite resistance protein TerC
MGTPLLWIGFNVFVLVCIALDLGVFNRRLHKVSLREAGLFSLVWVALSILFGLGILHYSGKQAGLEFFTGYLIEKALSVDNLFLFLVIFRTFSIDERFQHRMLEWGILGALVMRGLMILAGAELIERFSWVLYVFGGFIVYAGIHMLFIKKEKVHPEQSFIFRFASKHLRVTHDYKGEHFFVRSGGKLYATPLFLVLLVVEITDITLAIDSIPAIFGITQDPFRHPGFARHVFPAGRSVDSTAVPDGGAIVRADLHWRKDDCAQVGGHSRIYFVTDRRRHFACRTRRFSAFPSS